MLIIFQFYSHLNSIFSEYTHHTASIQTAFLLHIDSIQTEFFLNITSIQFHFFSIYTPSYVNTLNFFSIPEMFTAFPVNTNYIGYIETQFFYIAMEKRWHREIGIKFQYNVADNMESDLNTGMRSQYKKFQFY